MEKNIRLKQVIEYLIENKIIKNQKDLMKKLGYKSTASWSSVVNGRYNVPEKTFLKISKLDKKLNLEWLLTGNGKMIIDSTIINNEHSQHSPISIKNTTDKNDFFHELLKTKDEVIKLQQQLLQSKNDIIELLKNKK
jgi:hypothetical protein